MDDKRERFEVQVLPHLDAAYRFARWLGPGGADADDVVQEAFLRAFRAFDSLRGTDVKGWLLTIVRNCHATAARQQQRAPAPLPEEEAGPLATLVSAAPTRRARRSPTRPSARWRTSSQRCRNSTAKYCCCAKWRN